MNEAFAQALVAFELAVRLSLPVLAVAFAVGLGLSLLQAWARLGDPALHVLPRALAALVVLGSVGGWMARELVAYTAALFRALPDLVR